MRRGTTPTHIFTIPLDSQQIKSVRVVYAQEGRAVIVKENGAFTMNGNVIKLKLTQAETLSLQHDKNVKIQMRFVLNSGESFVSDIKSRYVFPCLDDEVLS